MPYSEHGSTDSALGPLADLVAHELAEVRPFGIAHFDWSLGHDQLLGNFVNFVGYGADGVTRLEIWYGLPHHDPRAYDAFSCTISRGEVRLYVSDYLAHCGRDKTFLSNVSRCPPDAFIRSAIRGIGELGSIVDLSAPLSGADLIEIPIDWEGYR